MLQDIAGGTRLEGPDGIRHIRVHGEKDNFYRWVNLFNLANSLNPVQ